VKMAKISVNDLLQAGVHFGHQRRRWNPKMRPYIYGVRHGVTIFDLTTTIKHLAQACDFLRETAAAGGKVLFVGTKRQARDLVQRSAEECGMFHMCDRWLGGTLTNNRIIMSRAQHMKKLRQMEDAGEIDKMPNKEASRARRELSKLERSLSGIANMRKLPQAMVVVDIERDDIAVREARRLGIPVVAVVDSNCDPDPIDYIVPANDDAVRSLKVLLGAFVAAIQEGLNQSGLVTEVPEAEAAAAEPAEAAEPAAPEAPAEASVEETAPAPAEPAAAAAVEEEAVAAPAAEVAAEVSEEEVAAQATEEAPAEEDEAKK
jgi:small subunit ribosomal protein S2